MFFIKSRQIIVDCFTSRPDVFEFAKPDKATNFFPKWWKELNANEVNMKGCAGFIDLFSNSFCFPMWSDLSVEIGAAGSEQYIWQFADETSIAISHNKEQWGDFLTADYQHLKLENPWALRSKDKCNFYFSQPVYNGIGINEQDGIVILPGIINFKYQSSLNINILFKRGIEPNNFMFDFGMPIGSITPMTERKVKLKYHLVTIEEERNIRLSTSPKISFTKSYYKLKKIKSRGKCPLGFSK